MLEKDDLLNMIFPKGIKCIACGDELFFSPQDFLCEACQLPYFENSCVKCGREKDGMGDYCRDCKEFFWHFDEARSVCNLEKSARKLIYGLKYGGERYLKEYLAALIIEKVIAPIDWEFDYIVSVPLHKKRQKRRGYNQSELIAKSISKELNKPCVEFLAKTKYTKNLAKLNKEARIEIIGGTFFFNPKTVFADSINESLFLKYKNNLKIKHAKKDLAVLKENDKILKKAAKNILGQKNILLIDDVFTTGSTINECAKILKSAGVNNVYVATFGSMKVKTLLF